MKQGSEPGRNQDSMLQGEERVRAKALSLSTVAREDGGREGGCTLPPETQLV